MLRYRSAPARAMSSVEGGWEVSFFFFFSKASAKPQPKGKDKPETVDEGYQPAAAYQEPLAINKHEW